MLGAGCGVTGVHTGYSAAVLQLCVLCCLLAPVLTLLPSRNSAYSAAFSQQCFLCCLLATVLTLLPSWVFRIQTWRKERAVQGRTPGLKPYKKGETKKQKNSNKEKWNGKRVRTLILDSRRAFALKHPCLGPQKTHIKSRLCVAPI